MEGRVRKLMGVAAASAVLLLLGSAAPLEPLTAQEPGPAEPRTPPMFVLAQASIAAIPPAPPPPPPPPTPQEALADGVLIVVSIPDQHMYVFRDGALWDDSPVSTGRRGHETPTGTFNILQKRVMHRSNIYDGAPMPFMQRLTWTGIALHAGHVPGRPASHGCVRMPREFAERLYRITAHMTTAVVITDEALENEAEALAISRDAPPADEIV